MIPATPNRRGFLPITVTGVKCYLCHKTRHRRGHLSYRTSTMSRRRQTVSDVNRLPNTRFCLEASTQTVATHAGPNDSESTAARADLSL